MSNPITTAGVVPPIIVWMFRDAPQALQAQSPHGGDEDWVALVPIEYADTYIGWAVSGSNFGCCDVATIPQPDGSVLLIGAHA